MAGMRVSHSEALARTVPEPVGMILARYATDA